MKRLKTKNNLREKSKLICVLLALLVTAGSFSGCLLDEKKSVENVTEKKGRLSTTSANYDFVKTPDDNRNQPAVPEIELSKLTKFFTVSMDDKTLGVYKQLYSGIINLKENIDITDKVINKEDIGKLFELCTSVSPEISYINQDYTISLDDEDYVTAISVKYVKTKEQIDAENSAVEKRAEEIVNSIPADYDEYNKVKFLHDTIITSCVYSEDSANAYSAYGCLCEGRAVCEGYTKAMLMLCGKAGIKAIPVVGKGVSSNSWQPHMWNKIRIDGNWYNFDLTWDDPISDFGEDYVRYEYFGLDDEAMNKDHIPDDSKYMSYPVATSTDADYYIKNNIYCTDQEEMEDIVTNAVDLAFQSGDVYVRIKCADEELFDVLINDYFTADSTNPYIFTVMENCGAQEYGYNSSGYSLIKNKSACTVTVRLDKL